MTNEELAQGNLLKSDIDLIEHVITALSAADIVSADQRLTAISKNYNNATFSDSGTNESLNILISDFHSQYIAELQGRKTALTTTMLAIGNSEEAPPTDA